MDLLWQTAINATYAASYMSLIAVGLVMIFGVMGVINFAHGELYMVGAYCVVFLYAQENFPFLVAVAAGLVFVGIVGLLMERVMFRPLRDNPLSGLIASIRLSADPADPGRAGLRPADGPCPAGDPGQVRDFRCDPDPPTVARDRCRRCAAGRVVGVPQTYQVRLGAARPAPRMRRPRRSRGSR